MTSEAPPVPKHAKFDRMFLLPCCFQVEQTQGQSLVSRLIHACCNGIIHSSSGCVEAKAELHDVCATVACGLAGRLTEETCKKAPPGAKGGSLSLTRLTECHVEGYARNPVPAWDMSCSATTGQGRTVLNLVVPASMHSERSVASSRALRMWLWRQV